MDIRSRRRVLSVAKEVLKEAATRISHVKKVLKRDASIARGSRINSLDDLLKEPVDMSIYEGYSLDELLSGHVEPSKELDWGRPVGKEIW